MNEENLQNQSQVSESAPAPVQTPQYAPGTRMGLPGIGQLFGDTWRIYVEHLKTSVLLQLLNIVIFVVFILIALLAGWIYTQGIDTTLFIILAVIVGVPLFLASIAFSVCIQAAQILIYESPANQLGIKQALEKTKPFFKQYFWVSILTILIMIAGFVPLMIPGLILAVLLIFSTYITVIEGKKGFDALIASREYVRGYGWPVFGRLLLGFVVLFGVSIVIGIISGIIESMGITGFSSIVSFALNIVLAPIYVAFILILYRQLKALKGQVEVPAGQSSGYKLAAIYGAVLFVLMIAGIAYTMFAIPTTAYPSQGKQPVLDQETMKQLEEFNRMNNMEINLENIK